MHGGLERPSDVVMFSRVFILFPFFLFLYSQFLPFIALTTIDLDLNQSEITGLGAINIVTATCDLQLG